MKITLKKLQHKASGIWFWIHTKQAWRKSYYSADGEKTWHASKTQAFRTAMANDNLEVA